MMRCMGSSTNLRRVRLFRLGLQLPEAAGVRAAGSACTRQGRAAASRVRAGDGAMGLHLMVPSSFFWPTDSTCSGRVGSVRCY